jgi:hypothetical protein
VLLGFIEEAEQHGFFYVVLSVRQYVVHECVDVVHAEEHAARFVFDLAFFHRGIEARLKIGVD